MSSIRDLARRVADLQREVRRLSTQPQLGNSSVEGGAIEFYDANDQLTMVVGTQYDGTSTTAVVSGPTPPTPLLPGVSAVPGGLVVVWSGDFEGGAVAPMDFARVEVHVSTLANFIPDTSTLRGTLGSPSGGEFFASLSDIVEHYACLVARSESGKASTPSAQVAGTPLPIPVGTAEATFAIAGAGTQTLTLPTLPAGRVDLWWGGAWQPASEWSISGQTITVPDVPALFAAGQEFVVKYDV